jgi:hypothetical protein
VNKGIFQTFAMYFNTNFIQQGERAYCHKGIVMRYKFNDIAINSIAKKKPAVADKNVCLGLDTLIQAI